MAPRNDHTADNQEVKDSDYRRGSVGSVALRWLLVVMIIGFLGYYYAMQRIDEKLTGEIVSKLRKELPGYVIALDRASLQPGKSILLEGLRISRPTDRGNREVFRCSRIVCLGPVDWIGLAQGQVPIKQVIADGVEVGIWPLSDGRWSIQDLGNSKPLTPDFPRIDVRTGLVRIGSETGRDGQEIVCHDLHAKIGLMPRLNGNQVAPLVLDIEASVASSHFTRLSMHARVDDTKSSWIGRGQLEKMSFSPRLAAQLPVRIQRLLAPIDGLSCLAECRFDASYRDHQLHYDLQGMISEGRWHSSSFAFPMDDISGEIYCKDSDLQVRNLTARSGDARLQVAVDWHGMSQVSPLAMSAEITDLDLDQRLYLALPPSIQETWSKLRPAGKVNAKAAIRFDGQTWNPYVTVDAQNVSVHADFFPYPVTNLTGQFTYQHGRISAPALMGLAGDQTLRGSLELVQARPKWLMDLTLSADGPISIDETLIRALTPRDSEPGSLQQFIHTLHPTGTVYLKSGRFRRTADRPDLISKTIELTFSECTIKYDLFRYPIVDVHGEVTLDNQRLILRDFAGRNDGAQIKSFGVCQCKDSLLESLDLQFDAYDVGLDEELQSALPKSVRSLWDQLQPTGSMDHVQVAIRRNHARDPIDLRVEMNEKRDLNENIGRTVAFRPTAIPYTINDVACNIVYRPGRIDIRSLAGVHDASRLQAEGHCRLLLDGTWDGQVVWLPSTRFLVDQSLLSCLPNYLRDPLLRMDFRGPVSVTGSTQIASPSQQDASIVRSWDLDLQIEDGRLGGGGIASGMRGTITMKGENTPGGPIAFGKLDFDALAVKGIAVTGVTGPFFMTRSELNFGRDAIAKQNTIPQRLDLKGKEPTVASAYYFESATGDSRVEPATFRQQLQERIDARYDKRQNRRGTADSKVLEADLNSTRSPPVHDLPQLDLSENDIRARTLSGSLFVSGTEPLDGKRAKYRVRLVDAFLKDCLLDLGETNAEANGRLWLQCDLQGSITSLTSLEGSGNAWLREASLYQLPVMVRLLRLLSVRPDQGAFDAADIRFGIDGDRIPIHELQLDGDLVSLRGSGWINMRRELELDLLANVSKRTLVGAMMRPLSQSNAANLLRIQVTGNSANPQITQSMPLMKSLDPLLPQQP